MYRPQHFDIYSKHITKTIKKVYRVAISGDLSFADYDTLITFCDKIIRPRINPNTTICIVSGLLPGAEQLAKRYAKERGYAFGSPIDPPSCGNPIFLPNLLKNKDVDLFISFWDGKSPTAYALFQIAIQTKVETFVYDYINDITYSDTKK